MKGVFVALRNTIKSVTADAVRRNANTLSTVLSTFRSQRDKRVKAAVPGGKYVAEEEVFLCQSVSQ